MELWQLLLGPAITLLVGLVGTGLGAAIVYRAMRDRLREDFVTRDEFVKMESEVSANTLAAQEHVAMRAETSAVREQADRIEREHRAHAERLVEVMDRITEKLEKVSETQAATSAVLELILKNYEQS